MSTKSYARDAHDRSKKSWLHIRAGGHALFLGACCLLSGCAGQTIRQGHLFQPEDLQQVHEGMPKDQVILALGSPDTQTTVGGAAYYYISTTSTQKMAFLTPTITDRRVVAVYFDDRNNVSRVANYGLKDGKVFDFIKRETSTYNKDNGFLKDIFRNIGAKPAMPGIPGSSGQ
jgi:outer membrane protein assembly factor BamE (lipoprotein component of BamABCDE complex)